MTREEQLERAVRGLSLDERPPTHWDESAMRAFLERLQADGLTVNSQLTQTFAVANFARWLSERREKPLFEATAEDVNAYLASMDLQPKTKADRAWLIRKAYRVWTEAERYHGENPAGNHRPTGRKGNQSKLQASDLLTEEEALAIIEAADHPRDAALLALLWDAGARIDEILSLNIEDVRPHPDYPDGLLVIIRHSKTEPRELVVFDAIPWLVPWIERHPYRDTPSFPLFFNYARNREDDRLSDDGARLILKRAVERARRKVPSLRRKRVFPHLFRHSRATGLLRKGYNESALKARMGWSFATKMMARYVHWAARDHHAEDARLAGKEPAERPTPIARPECLVCGFENSSGARFCARCLRSLVLSEAAAKVQGRRALEKRLKALERMNASLAQILIMSNPDFAKTVANSGDPDLKEVLSGHTLEVKNRKTGEKKIIKNWPPWARGDEDQDQS